jgi:hypothetical protein
MNIREMQRNFMIKLRQFVEESEVESDDIEYYLNRAQDEYAKEQHFIIKDNYRNQQLGNIDIQRAVENLRTLVNTLKFDYDVDLFNSPSIDNALFAGLEGSKFTTGVTPKPYMYYLRSRLDADANNSLNCKIIDPTMLSKYTKTKYNSPLFREPAILIESNIIVIIYPVEVTPGPDTKFELTYITAPISMSIKNLVDCALPIHTHNEIVDMAVELKIKDLQKSREVGLDKSMYKKSN